MNRFVRWYGAGPLHLLALLGSFALAGYAAAVLLPVNAVGILIWFAGAVIGHDLILMPLYTVADRSVAAVFRHRPLPLPAVPWINYLRVPAALSGILLLIWFPLIFRLPGHFTASTTLPLDPYLWHWLAVTGALFLLSAIALALRLRAGRRAAAEEHAGPKPVELHPDATHSSAEMPSPSATHDPAITGGGSQETTGPSAITGPDAETDAASKAEPPSAVLPDAPLLDVHGAATTLYAVVGDSTSILVFYHGAWCPDCDRALAAYQAQLAPQLTARGIRLVAISPQKPDGSLATQQKRNPAFTVVSDPGNAVASLLSLSAQPSQEARAAQLRLGRDLADVNAGGTVTLPIAATVILDAGHAVRWIDVHPDCSTRTEPQQLIDAFDHLEQ